MPAENKKDLEELPETARREITFLPVSDAEEVFKEAITGFKIYPEKATKALKKQMKSQPDGEEFSSHRHGITC